MAYLFRTALAILSLLSPTLLASEFEEALPLLQRRHPSSTTVNTYTLYLVYLHIKSIYCIPPCIAYDEATVFSSNPNLESTFSDSALKFSRILIEPITWICVSMMKYDWFYFLNKFITINVLDLLSLVVSIIYCYCVLFSNQINSNIYIKTRMSKKGIILAWLFYFNQNPVFNGYANIYIPMTSIIPFLRITPHWRLHDYFHIYIYAQNAFSIYINRYVQNGIFNCWAILDSAFWCFVFDNCQDHGPTIDCQMPRGNCRKCFFLPIRSQQKNITVSMYKNS